MCPNMKKKQLHHATSKGTTFTFSRNTVYVSSLEICSPFPLRWFLSLKCYGTFTVLSSLFFITLYQLSVHYENMPIQNILKILPQKNENFQRKNSDIFHFSTQKIDCGYSLEPPRRGGSNEYPQSMFLSRNKKNNVYPYKPQFCYIKVGFKGVKII